MGLYRQHKLSLIRFIRGLGNGFSPPVPVFVDLDAHANVDTLPKQDFVGMSSYSMTLGNQEAAIFTSFACATWMDDDLMRLTGMVDALVEKLKPGMTVPLWMDNPAPGIEPKWMVVADNTMVEPTDKTDLRSMQLVTVRLLSSLSP